MALANIVAAMVDTMRMADVPNDVIHGFLDRLDGMNAITLAGLPAEIMAGLVEVVRGTVPIND